MFTSEYWHPAVVADVVFIVTDSKTFTPHILLVKRKNEPFKDKFALPGGFLDEGDDTLEDCAKRELFEETGIAINIENQNLLTVRSDKNRDPRERVISNVFMIDYICHLDMFTPTPNDDAVEAKWIPLKEINSSMLAFDHSKIIENAIKHLIYKRFSSMDEIDCSIRHDLLSVCYTLQKWGN